MDSDQFDSISPLDFRYVDQQTVACLSENAFTRYKLLVEIALVRTLCRYGLCSQETVKEIEDACRQITTDQVYQEEKRIGHDIRALVNCIQAKVSDQAKPFVHMTATSYDIIDCARAVQINALIHDVVIPSLFDLEKVLIEITLREADTVQIGRTHGQHAVPITFGFALAEYVSRLGASIETIQELAKNIKGKFSGAAGAYNASSLFFHEPENFEEEVLAELGLKPAEHSTQIAPPEAMARTLCETTIIAGILSNLARDMRNLQRTEIGEVGEKFETDQVGSSTMPQKRNPINFENIESMGKIVNSRMSAVFMDQISEHQRDLTNSASGRTHIEIFAYTILMIKRMTTTMKKLVIDQSNIVRNLAMQKDLVLAEPLYIILAALGHPNAHQAVKILTIKAQHEHRSLQEIINEDKELEKYINKMTAHQRNIISNPVLYTGIASRKAKVIAKRWKQKLGL